MIEAKPCHRICKAFAGDPFITEEQDHPFYHVDHFLFCSENLIQYPSFGGFLAPSPAYVDFVADQGFRYRAEWTLINTASAMITLLWIDPKLSVCYVCDFDRTAVLNLTVLTALAFGQIDLWQPLADDAQIIEIRFYTVIGTSAYRDLEFMRQGYFVVTRIIQVMQLLGQCKCVDQAVLAGRTFTGYHRAYLRAGAAGLKPGSD